MDIEEILGKKEKLEIINSVKEYVKSILDDELYDIADKMVAKYLKENKKEIESIAAKQAKAILPILTKRVLDNLLDGL